MLEAAFLTFDNVTVRQGGRTILTGIHWTILHGQNWVVWGANGAGKSTLAKALLGEAAVVNGFIQRHYEKTTGEDARRPAMALVSSDQYHRFYEQERMLAEMRGFSGRGRKTRGGDILNPPFEGDGRHAQRRKEIEQLFDLPPIFAKPLGTLSSGEMRRLLLGRALLSHPRMLLLDEPYNGLDAEGRAVLKNILEQLASGDTQMVLITHRPAEIPAGFDHLLHLDRGRAVWRGSRERFAARLAGRAGDLPLPPLAAEKGPSSADQGSSPDPSDRPLLEMQQVTVKIGRKLILDRVDWRVQSGENWAVVGPNGAGKSTLLKVITGDQLQGYANTICLFGFHKGTGETVGEIKRRIGQMDDILQARYQRDMSGLEVVCSGHWDSVGLYRTCSAGQMQAARRWLRNFNLEALAELRFARLSFGQQRLLLIARAMVKSPRLLILDEPCNGLDLDHRRRMIAMLDAICSGGETGLIYTSHRSDELPTCITHLLYLENGRVVRAATREKKIYPASVEAMA